MRPVYEERSGKGGRYGYQYDDRNHPQADCRAPGWSRYSVCGGGRRTRSGSGRRKFGGGADSLLPDVSSDALGFAFGQPGHIERELKERKIQVCSVFQEEEIGLGTCCAALNEQDHGSGPCKKCYADIHFVRRELE